MCYKLRKYEKVCWQLRKYAKSCKSIIMCAKCWESIYKWAQCYQFWKIMLRVKKYANCWETMQETGKVFKKLSKHCQDKNQMYSVLTISRMLSVGLCPNTGSFIGHSTKALNTKLELEYLSQNSSRNNFFPKVKIRF